MSYLPDHPLADVVQQIRDAGLRPSVGFEFSHHIWTLTVDGRLVAAALRMEELADAGGRWLAEANLTTVNQH